MFLHVSECVFLSYKVPFWSFRAVCFSLTLSCVCIHVHVVCVCASCRPHQPPRAPQSCVCVNVLWCVCVRSLFLCNTFRGPFWSGQHLSPAPIRLSLLTLSFTLERERRSEKKEEVGGGAVEITGCCLRRGSEKKEQGVRKGGKYGREKVFAVRISCNTGNVARVA